MENLRKITDLQANHYKDLTIIRIYCVEAIAID
ncbi:hypothetical protein L1275_001980 [Flavobacterium sp. HSC-61S13]|nr:hypothetical protein [Flavobacterium sp. HSC-61S13]